MGAKAKRPLTKAEQRALRAENKRRVFTVRWVSSAGAWAVSERGGLIHSYARRKVDAVQVAVKAAKAVPLGQVVIHKRNGQYQEERTYPRWSDPRRHPG